MAKNKMKKNFMAAGAALAMMAGSTMPVFAEDTTNNPTNYEEVQEGDYNTKDTHSDTTNDRVSGRAATTNVDGAVSKLDGKGENEATHAGSETKSADVLYQVAEGYTWTIHSLVDFGDSKGISNHSTVTKQDAIKVTRNVIPDGKKLSIKLDGVNNDYQVTNGGTKLSYTVANDAAGEHFISGSDEVMSVAAGTNTGSTPLQFKLETTSGTAEVAGDYHGTIAYIASIE